MTNAEIKAKWERMAELALYIQQTIWFQGNVAIAKAYQKELREWVAYCKANGIVYNGCYDEYIEREF